MITNSRKNVFIYFALFFALLLFFVTIFLLKTRSVATMQGKDADMQAIVILGKKKLNVHNLRMRWWWPKG